MEFMITMGPFIKVELSEATKRTSNQLSNKEWKN